MVSWILANVGSCNDSPSVERQAIAWINADFLSIGLKEKKASVLF